MAAAQSQAVREIQIPPATQGWSLLRGFMPRRAAPNYRTRRRPTCQARGRTALGGAKRGRAKESATCEYETRAARRACLSEQAYRVIRFRNEQVNREMDD